jgi:hypothetical protein
MPRLLSRLYLSVRKFRLPSPLARVTRFTARTTCFALMFLHHPVAFGQFTGAWLDASSTIFTSGAGGDMCKAINAAYQSTGLTTGTFFTGTIDARGFTGVQPCMTDPFGGGQSHYTYLLLNSNVQIVTGVGWFTPANAHVIDGGTPGGPVSTGSDIGAKIIACGPAAPGWNGTSLCNITVGGALVAVSQITTNPNLKFNVHHGPFAAANYTCILCIGGGQSGWNTDAFGAVLKGVRIELGGNSNIFGVYTKNAQETSEWSKVRCGGYGSNYLTMHPLGNSNSACAFVDRVEASAPGQSGPDNFVIDDWSIGADLFADGVNDYGIVSEGEDVVIEFTGMTCTISYPVAFVTGVTAGGVITSAQLQSVGSGCTGATPGATAWYPNTTGGFSSGQWSNTPQNGGATFSVILTMGSVSTFGLLLGGTGYPGSFLGGPRAIKNVTVVGSTVGASVYRLNGGIVIDGDATVNVDSVHCEKMVNTNGTGDCVQAGTYGFKAGGVFSNINSNSNVQGANLHFGKGIDNNQVVTSNASLATNLIVDDKNLPGTPLTSANCDTGGAGSSPAAGVIAIYLPGSFVRCGPNLGYYLPELASPPTSGLLGFDLLYSKSIHWPVFNPNNSGEQLFAGLSGTVASGHFPVLNSTTTGAMIDSGVNYQAPVFVTSVSTPLYTSPASPGTLTIQPGADTTQSILFKTNGGGGTTVASIDTNTVGGQLAIGKSTAPSATLDVAGTFLVQSGEVSKYRSTATVRGGVPSIIATDDESGKSGTITAQPLTNSTPFSGLYRACFAAVVTRAASTTSTLGGVNTGFQITYTDSDTSGTVITPFAAAPVGGSNFAYSQTNSQNIAGAQASGCVTVSSVSGGPIKYSFGYSTSGVTPMQYAIHVSLEALY